MKIIITLLMCYVFSAGSDWPMFHKTPDFTGNAADEVLDLDNLVKDSINLGSRITAGPVVRGDTVYVGTHGGRLCAVRNGELLWSTLLNGPTHKILGEAVVAGNQVIVGSTDGKVYYLNLDGSISRTFPLEGTIGQIVSPINFIENRNRIYVNGGDGYFYCLSLDGAIIWSYNTNANGLFVAAELGVPPEIMFGSPYNANDSTLIVSAPYGLSYKLKDMGSSCVVIDSMTTRGSKADGTSGFCQPYYTPCILNGFFPLSFAFKERGYSYELCSLDSMSLVQKGASGIFSYIAPVACSFGDTTAFYMQYERTIYKATNLDFGSSAKANAINGCYRTAKLWPSSSPALSRDYLIGQTDNGTIYILDKGNLSLVKEFAFCDTFGLKYGFKHSKSAPAISNGRVYFGAENGCLYILGKGNVKIESKSNLVPSLKLTSAPNPFNPSTTIRCSGLTDVNYRLCIYNTLGKLVFDTFKNGSELQDGVKWKSIEQPSGFYTAVLTGSHGLLLKQGITLVK
ncbi:MAG: PQQ-binding-like beta-propeller repeat protein [Fibrobacteres bacterium]|nr:PQQ-binding-like beta-propeller repeat protein [Fibrobacterota bacterium]